MLYISSGLFFEEAAVLNPAYTAFLAQSKLNRREELPETLISFIPLSAKPIVCTSKALQHTPLQGYINNKPLPHLPALVLNYWDSALYSNL